MDFLLSVVAQNGKMAGGVSIFDNVQMSLGEDFTPNRDTAARLGWQLDIGPVATNAHEALARR